MGSHIIVDGISRQIEKGISAEELAEKLNLREPAQAVAVEINGEMKDLATRLEEGDHLRFFSFDDPEGKEVFWHTSAHVLAQAILRLWPDAKPTIGPPIEQGFYYDFANLHISEEDFPKIEEEVEKVLKEKYRPCRHEFQTKQEALGKFKENPYKSELIESFEGPISGYSQGEFFDLCRGPHLMSLGKIKAFKVMKTSGAYWRGDSSKEMLTRIYAISFPDRKLLKEYLELLEEAKKRDHRLIGQKLDLFSIKEEAPGMPLIHPKGLFIWNQLVEFLRSLQNEEGYTEIKTPTLMNQQLWERSGHWAYYRQNMYSFDIENRFFAIKPMNCPGCMLYYKSHSHSYRDFPLRVAEFGHVHRHEASGALSGLFRVRSFTQDDAHIFMLPEQIKGEILGALRLVRTVYSTFGLDYRFELSTRPEKSIGSELEWERATEGLKGALDEWGMPYKVNEGDGAFYGPKIDIHIRDAIGRSWQCGTIQLDMFLPERFDLTFRDADGEEKRPVMIHRAIFGSVERFFGILIEHFVGKFPLWLSPEPIRILIVADRHLPYAEAAAAAFRKGGFRATIDHTSESVGKKVRAAQLDQVNYILTVGDREVEENSLSLRTRDNVVHGAITVGHLLEKLEEERRTKALHSPFSAVSSS